MLPVQKGYVDFSSHHHIFCLDSFQLQKIIGFSYLNTITRWWQLKYFRNFHPETAGEDSWYFHFDLRTFFVAGWWKNPPNPKRFVADCCGGWKSQGRRSGREGGGQSQRESQGEGESQRWKVPIFFLVSPKDHGDSWGFLGIFEEGTSIVILEMILYGDHSYDWWAVMTQGVPGQLCTPNSVPMVCIGILGDYDS